MTSRTSHWLLALSLCAANAQISQADEPAEKPSPKPEATEKQAEKPRPKPEATEKQTEKPRSKPGATEKQAEKPRPKSEATEKQAEKPRSKPEATEKPRGEKPASPPQLKERLTDLLAQARDAEADGNRERLRDIKAQITEVEQLLKRSAPGIYEIPPDFRPQAERLEVLAHHIKHVRTAAESLKAAEMHDLAHELGQRAEAMERELAHAKQELMQQIQPNKSARPEPGSAERELNALREENQALQKKLRELSEQREERGEFFERLGNSPK